MKELGIRKSVLSISSPGTHLTPGNDEDARALTRQVNVDMSKIVAEHPDHFLFFASLPLPDVEGSLTEIDFALDKLGAVGFQILSNSHGIYPGDDRFKAVFDKLSDRNATVFVHPTSCNIRGENGTVQLVNPQPGFPRPMVEFMFDSSRALMSILISGTLQRCPGITLLMCHCGAAFPPLMHRITEFSQVLLPPGQRISGEEVREILQSRVYFDLAGVPFPDQIHGLLRIVDSSRLLYGSDYPYTKAPTVRKLLESLDKGLGEECGRAITEQVMNENGSRFLKGIKDV